MVPFAKFEQGLTYQDFLARYANAGQKERWQKIYDSVALTTAQRSLLGFFRRAMNVLCLAGAWCGDCINQCPIFEHFAVAAPGIRVRYLDRDDWGRLTIRRGPGLFATFGCNGCQLGGPEGEGYGVASCRSTPAIAFRSSFSSVRTAPRLPAMASAP